MTIRSRLLTAFGIVAVLLTLPLAYGLLQLRTLRGIAVALHGQHAEAYAALGTLREGLAEYDRNARSYVITPDPDFRLGMRDAVARMKEATGRLATAGYAQDAEPLAARIESLIVRTGALETLVETGDAHEATAFLSQVLEPGLARAQADVPVLGRTVERASTAAALEAQAITANAVRQATVAALLALLLGAGVAWWMTATLTGPLGRLRHDMAVVASGTLSTGRLPFGRRDEIGELCRSFATMTRRLDELDRMRGEFLNVVSHDLKAPLTLIRGCVELIEEADATGLGPDERELLRSIREHVAMLSRRVEQLLNLGRLEARAYPLHPEDVLVGSMFEMLRFSYERQARHQGIALAMTVEPSVPAIVRADPDGLQQEIVGNLLSNALKFTPTGGQITVRVWGADDRLHFSVADTGVGIPAEDLPRVFSKYYQAHGHGGHGTGLGLAIVRQVVEAHGGNITAQSTRPGGTTFQVSLPVAGPPVSADAPSAAAQPVTRRWRVALGSRPTRPWRARPVDERAPQGR